MLQELNIENFALIERLSVRFGAGLNVLTGETGAGKSIVIDAISAILGERMSSDVVRFGTSKAAVEGVFDLCGAPDRIAELTEAGALDPGEAALLVSRDFASAGKSSSRVGGRLVNLSFLREVSRNLVDIHGQHEHQSLLDPSQHVTILDDWCGQPAAELRDQCAAVHARCRALSRDLANIQMDEREKERRLDLLRYQAEEIDAAHLEADEEEALVSERSRLANMEKLMDQVARARGLLSGVEGIVESAGALDTLGAAVRLLDDSCRDDPLLQPVLDSLQSALYTVQEAAHEVTAYHENLETNPDRLEQVEERLALLRGLRRKYGDTVAEILELRGQIELEMSQIRSAEDREAELKVQLQGAEIELRQAAEALSGTRSRAARDLERRLASELAEVALPGAILRIEMTPQDPGPSGADRVEFLFSANPGEPARPLSRIVSGGEVSRIMLAIKSLLAVSVGAPTVIFDEIDVGVGGRTGEAIGLKLQAVGEIAQVICVTHLPQIAALAAQHFVVRKAVAAGRTTVDVSMLSEQDRVDEIARMLGGGQETARRHARDMLSVRKNAKSRVAASSRLLELEV
ncbi:MAG TPA: DNA repair protein RecN [Armatimonadota bacterium]|nr:DNA repair protein RecN [Armatimonadota bacterium]